DDPSLLPPGHGFFYMVQAESYDCGLGTLGIGPSEQERVNTSPGACSAKSTDYRAIGETTVFGSKSGNYMATFTEDDAVETINDLVSGGFRRLHHRWLFNAARGARMSLHIEGLRSVPADGDDFQFQSSPASIPFTALALSLPTSDEDHDRSVDLPPNLSGSV